MYYTYVLKSEKDNRLYIGYTKDLKRRISEHQAGYITSTSPRRPLILVFYEAFLSEADARRREKYFKTGKGKAGLKQIIRESLSQTPNQPCP